MKRKKNKKIGLYFSIGLLAILLAFIHQFLYSYKSIRLVFLVTGLVYFIVGVYIKEKKILGLFLGINFCWWLMVEITTGFYGKWWIIALDLICLIVPLIIGNKVQRNVHQKQRYIDLSLFFGSLLSLYFILVPYFIFTERLHLIAESSQKIPDWFYEATLVSESDEDHKGRIAYLDFWFTQCGNCFKGFEELQELHDYYKDNPDVSVYAVHSGVGGEEEIDKGITRVRNLGYDFQILIDSLGTFKESGLAKVYPSQLLVDKEGRAKYRLEGYAREIRYWKKNWLKRNISKMLR